MALKTDRWVRQMTLAHDMIRPLSDKQVARGVVSYGLSSCGYNAWPTSLSQTLEAFGVLGQIRREYATNSQDDDDDWA